MKRQNIILGSYTYIIDWYNAESDMKNNPHYAKFVAIKYADVINTISCDSDVYFIEQSIIDESTNADGSIDWNAISNKIVYPIIESDKTGYSYDYKLFNSNFNKHTLKYGNELYQLYDNSYNVANIKCDKIRIYFPTVKPELDAIICIDNYINNIHFYYLCRTISQYDIHSETEFEIDHTLYSEYIELYVPNAEYLFNKNQIYITNNVNVNNIRQQFDIDFVQNGKDCKLSLFANVNPTYVDDITRNVLDITFNTKYTSEISFTVKTDNEYVYKTKSIKLSIDKQILSGNNLTIDDVINDIKTSNIHLPGIYISNSSNRNAYFLTVNYIYIDEDNFDMGSYEAIYNINNSDSVIYTFNIMFDDVDDMSDIYFEFNGIKHNIDINLTKFVDNKNFVALSTFISPYSVEYDPEIAKFKKVYVNTSENVMHNHLTYPVNIILFPYSGINTDIKQYEIDTTYDYNSETFSFDFNFKLKSNLEFVNGKLNVASRFAFPDKYSTIWDAYTQYFNINEDTYSVDPDYDEENEDFYYNTNISRIGYRIEMSADDSFNSLIYNYDMNIDINDLHDFAFPLDNIFDSWNNYPELIILRTMMIDKVLNNILISNSVILTKEQYKYLINDIPTHRLINIVDMQADPYLTKNNNEDTMDLTKFNFIDKITCVVNKTDTTSTISKQSNAPKILYKPIFYRVAELQNVKIKSGVTQNIGINVSDLLSKVETFKLVLDNRIYIESARNDIYVLFNVNASELNSSSGVYSLTNQDDEFISDGNWYLY